MNNNNSHNNYNNNNQCKQTKKLSNKQPIILITVNKSFKNKMNVLPLLSHYHQIK